MLSEERIRAVFRLSLAFKAAFSVLEIVGGALAFFVSQRRLLGVITAITQQELLEDPRDFVARHLVEAAAHVSAGSQHFAALYLLSHGLVKTWLIVGLLRDRLWYYPIAIVAFLLFAAYQVYRFQITHSAWLLVLTVVDIVVVVLTWHEYRYLRRRRETQPDRSP